MCTLYIYDRRTIATCCISYRSLRGLLHSCMPEHDVTPVPCAAMRGDDACSCYAMLTSVASYVHACVCCH